VEQCRIDMPISIDWINSVFGDHQHERSIGTRDREEYNLNSASVLPSQLIVGMAGTSLGTLYLTSPYYALELAVHIMRVSGGTWRPDKGTKLV
jgi:hypothetical protein